MLMTSYPVSMFLWQIFDTALRSLLLSSASSLAWSSRQEASMLMTSYPVSMFLWRIVDTALRSLLLSSASSLVWSSRQEASMPMTSFPVSIFLWRIVDTALQSLLLSSASSSSLSSHQEVLMLMTSFPVSTFLDAAAGIPPHRPNPSTRGTAGICRRNVLGTVRGTVTVPMCSHGSDASSGPSGRHRTTSADERRS